MIHTPSAIAKVIVIIFMWILIHMDTVSKTFLQTIWSQNKNGTGDEMTPFSVPACQRLLFCSFLNILSLHLPSFIWTYRVHKPKCIALLEHILHYYFTLALVLYLFSKSHLHFKVSQAITEFNEMVVATQMSLYFLWHIYHEIKMRTHHLKKPCTLFSDFIEMSICVFVIGVIPIFWANNTFTSNTNAEDSLFKNGLYCLEKGASTRLLDKGNIQSMMFQLGYLYSFFVFCDLGSIAFHLIERSYLIFFTNSDQ